MMHVLSDVLQAFDFSTSEDGTIQTAASSMRLELLNGFLFLIGLYALVVFIPFLRYTWRTGQRSGVAEAVYLHLIGHTLFRGWTWLVWHSVNEHWDIRWMASFPVWEASSVIIGISIVWLANIMTERTFVRASGLWRGWVLPLGLAIVGTLALRAL